MRFENSSWEKYYCKIAIWMQIIQSRYIKSFEHLPNISLCTQKKILGQVLKRWTDENNGKMQATVLSRSIHVQDAEAAPDNDRMCSFLRQLRPLLAVIYNAVHDTSALHQPQTQTTSLIKQTLQFHRAPGDKQQTVRMHYRDDNWRV